MPRLHHLSWRDYEEPQGGFDAMATILEYNKSIIKKT